MIEELKNLTASIKDNFLDFLPNIIMATLILGIGYLLARLVKHLIGKMGKRLGNMVNQRYNEIDLNQSAKFIGTVFFWIILLIACIFAANILGISIVSKWMESILIYSPNVIAAILIISVAVIFGKFAAGVILAFGQRVGLDHAQTLGKIAQYTILLTAIIIAIDQIGFEIKFLIDIIYIILASTFFATALAFGLGARTSVSNILAVFYVRKRYKVGDTIKIGEVEGRIIKIDVTIVVLDTEDGQVSIPAKEFNENVSCLIKKK